MDAQRSPEDPTITIDGLSGDPLIECSIDPEGDLCIEHKTTEMYVYIPAFELPKLRDLLNKVLP
jgi:hypothetical protein